ncbi:MAG: thiamine-phosphate kinase [Nitrospira sp. BO4]|nr:thiamine-phosphate kinase [Nitrospira sp. BO4]
MARPKAKPALQEFALIRDLQRRYARHASGLVQGIGDDAAVIATSTPAWWHLTTDLLAEGIHFDLKSATPESVGYRAAMANLSDIAAMGAVPRYLLVALAIPKTFKRPQVDELYGGLMKACRLYGVALVGGDTSASMAGLFLSITLIGTSTKHRALFRHGAKVGDQIFVSGTLGDSLAGLRLSGRGKRSRSSGTRSAPLSHSHRQFLMRRHFYPTARVAEGQWLNSERLASAAIDVSDGLSGDLRHICEESRVGAEVELGKIPISSACRAYAQAVGVSPVQLALTGGEDYELLFTASPKNRELLERQARVRGYRVTCIGMIRPQRFGMQMTSDGRILPMPVTSYEHFH